MFEIIQLLLKEHFKRKHSQIFLRKDHFKRKHSQILLRKDHSHYLALEPKISPSSSFSHSLLEKIKWQHFNTLKIFQKSPLLSDQSPLFILLFNVSHPQILLKPHTCKTNIYLSHA